VGRNSPEKRSGCGRVEAERLKDARKTTRTLNIKDLRYVAPFQNPQQAMYSLRETVLKNSMAKQNQQALGALAIGGLVILALVGMSKG
jgi:hypothetical protein